MLNHWLKPSRISLTGKYVQIFPANTEADIDELYEASHVPSEYQVLWKYLWNGPFQTKSDMKSWLKSIEKKEDTLFFTVTSLERKRKIGMIAILNIEITMGRAEIGHIWYSPPVQKTMVNTETTYLMLQYLFGELQYRRVEWKCDNNNKPSKATALRMGFMFEGLFRQHMVIKGKNRDTAWFSMLDREWPARKSNFEKYLANPSALSLRELNKAKEV